jgi:hypothetical protein
MNSLGFERRAIVQVRGGPMAWHKAILKPGQVLRVGRAEAMGLAVPHDAKMSEAHFELSWDGRQGRVKDLGSSMGTRVGGERVKQGEVFNGSWVRAGHTDFLVYFERTTPPRESGAALPTEQEALNKAKALEVLRAQESPLHAILDAARGERILELLRESVEDCRSLYEGPQGEALADVAPYLVRMPKESWLLEALVQEGWGSAWGIYLTSPQPFLELRRHLRKFLMVEAEGMDGRLYFRFYDPRVLQTFLPSCLPEQRKEFFGNINSFLAEGEDGTVLLFP